MSKLDLLLFSEIQKAKGNYCKDRDATQYDIIPKVLGLSSWEAKLHEKPHTKLSIFFVKAVRAII